MTYMSQLGEKGEMEDFCQKRFVLPKENDDTPIENK
jgi:hypothetical protein